MKYALSRISAVNPELGSPQKEEEPSLTCILFRKKGWTFDDYKNWTYDNHRSGFVLVAPTKWKSGGKYETVSRFCFINP